MSLRSKTNRWWLLGVAATTAAVVAAGSPDDDSARAAPLLNTPLVVRSCEYQCRECINEEQHDIVESVHHSARSSHLENCNTGECSAHACGFEEGSLMAQSESQRIGDFSNALRAAKNRDVRAVLSRFADVATYNPKRRSVQVFCDAGFVVANIPLSPRAVAYLAE